MTRDAETMIGRDLDAAVNLIWDARYALADHAACVARLRRVARAYVTYRASHEAGRDAAMDALEPGDLAEDEA